MNTNAAGSRAAGGRGRGPRPGLWLPALVIGASVAFAGESGGVSAGAFEAVLLDMEWQIGQGVAAPWAPAAGASRRFALAGQRMRFAARSVAAPAPLACDEARHEYVLSPAEGLFQGMLPPPAVQGARTLGLTHLPLLTLRVSCDGGVFDYHLVTHDKALLGLDDIVWPLVRRGGGTAPEHVVLALYQLHLTHDMAFTPATVANKEVHLTAGLRTAIAAYFRRTVAHDAVPVVDGDPFTNTQEYPTRLVPGRASIEGRRAAMPVLLGDDAASQVVQVLLRQSGRRWRVDDLRYQDGGTLRGRLQSAPRPAP